MGDRPGTMVLGLALLFAIGCDRGGSDAGPAPQTVYQGEGPIQAMATVGMVADIVRNVGGTHVQTRQIMGSGIDPHLYKPTRDDVLALMDSDVIFYGGLMLEGKMIDTLVKMARSKPVVAVTEAVPDDALLEPEGAAGHYDPHVWMDVSLWSQCAGAVAAALAEFDPPHAADYAANAAAYQQQLQQLHEYGRRSIATIPEDRRVLITSHDAFGYFGRAYDLEVQGVQGLSTESEAGLQQINQLVDLIVERKIQAVFVESSVPRKNIESLIDGAQSRGHAVTIGGELYSDAMGPTGTYEGTYVGMLDHNITLVTRALGGDAPERGMQGRLSGETR